ncbi:MAG TPA: hypothetical protein VFV28_04430 [Limnobacter sp.]|nr:hypothetical protein [Limnobacter sp.]
MKLKRAGFPEGEALGISLLSGLNTDRDFVRQVERHGATVLTVLTQPCEC